MKTLKFTHDLANAIHDGSKTSTWRLFDDKKLSFGDHLEFIDSDTGIKFAKAKITKISEKKLSEINEKDYEGHEKFNSPEELLETFIKYYGDEASWDTPVKIVEFRLI